MVKTFVSGYFFNTISRRVPFETPAANNLYGFSREVFLSKPAIGVAKMAG